MRITPGVISEVVRVYKDKCPRSMRDRWEKPQKKKEGSKKDIDRKCMCGRSAPNDDRCVCGRWHIIV